MTRQGYAPWRWGGCLCRHRRLPCHPCTTGPTVTSLKGETGSMRRGGGSGGRFSLRFQAWRQAHPALTCSKDETGACAVVVRWVVSLLLSLKSHRPHPHLLERQDRGMRRGGGAGVSHHHPTGPHPALDTLHNLLASPDHGWLTTPASLSYDETGWHQDGKVGLVVVEP